MLIILTVCVILALACALWLDEGPIFSSCLAIPHISEHVFIVDFLYDNVLVE
jgi:hypothetical protein